MNSPDAAVNDRNETSDGLSVDSVDSLIEKVAQLKASEPVPKAINEASEVAAAMAAKVASSPRAAISPDVRRAFAELLTANSEMLHRNARRSA